VVRKMPNVLSDGVINIIMPNVNAVITMVFITRSFCMVVTNVADNVDYVMQK